RQRIVEADITLPMAIANLEPVQRHEQRADRRAFAMALSAVHVPVPGHTLDHRRASEGGIPACRFRLLFTGHLPPPAPAITYPRDLTSPPGFPAGRSTRCQPPPDAAARRVKAAQPGSSGRSR